MKTIIFYSSTYNGNTLKIAESMAAALSADLVPIEAKISDIDLSKYDLIGFGSYILPGILSGYSVLFQNCPYRKSRSLYFLPVAVRS